MAVVVVWSPVRWAHGTDGMCRVARMHVVRGDAWPVFSPCNTRMNVTLDQKKYLELVGLPAFPHVGSGRSAGTMWSSNDGSA